ncbi:LysO family transporter [Saccharicrinis sp. FJH54]|uniref:LysO family transporter n=1 Tax=Saccharicrinis sp. FJH54 TaxID=3344665 RepID=UPI0035D4B91A
MLTILLIFVAGILTGHIVKKRKGIIKTSSRLTFLSVLALLFLLGYEAGHNPQVQAHFDTIGIKALVISLFSVAGSIIFIVIYNRLILKK